MSCAETHVAGPMPGPEQWGVLLEQSAREVFGLMLGTDLGLDDGNAAADDCSVTAFVGIAGDIRGVICLITSHEAVQKMASAMLHTPPKVPDSVAWDAFGEICNMVGGSFKGKLAGAYPHCVLSLPTVVNGADYNIHVLDYGLTAEARFTFEGHLFRILLEFQPQAPSY